MRLYINLLLCVLCGCTQKATTVNPFAAEDCKQWMQHAMHPFFSVETDKKDSTVIRMYTRGKQKGVLGKSFENPFGENTPVDVHLKYQTRDCLYSQLVAFFFNQDAELTGSDTLLLPQTAEWAEISAEIQTKKCDFLTLVFESQGLNDKLPGVLSVQELTLSAAGEALSATKERKVCPIGTADIQTGEGLLSSPLMGKKILALGETVHGTETLGNLALSLMKERVLHHGSKLLLFELPVEFTLALNRYIKNDKRFDQSYTDIGHRLRGSLLTDSILSFFDWVKAYNATHNNEVSLYGVDFSPIHLHGEVDICNFLYTLNHKRIPTMDTLCSALLNKDSKADEILRQLKANEEVRQELTEMEYNLLLYCFSNWDTRNSFMRFGMRDDVMAAITQKLVTLSASPNATTTMYLHFGHASYHWTGQSDRSFVYFPDIRSMGQQLKAHYADDYVCLALTCFEGKATSGEQHIFKTQPLKDAPENSIEYQMSKKGKAVSFLPVSGIPANCTYYMRHLGNRHTGNQFFRLSPQAWTDGIVLAEKAEACRKDKENARNPTMEAIKRLEAFYKKRR